MLIYQILTSTPANDFNTTGVKVSIPVCESLKIVEYGFLSVATDPGTTGVLKLQYVDGAASPNTVDLDSFTPVAAVAVGDLVSRRVDVHIDRLLDKYVASLEGTPGTLTSEADGIVGVQLNVTTAFGAGVTATAYIKFALAGTMKTAGTSQTLA